MRRSRVKNPLADPVRIAMLRGSGLLAAPPDEGLERLAALAGKVMRAPIAMVTLVDDTHLHAKSCAGSRDLVAKAGRTPVRETFCRHVVGAGEPLIVADARQSELTRGMAVVKSGKALAYLGVPLVLRGHVLGTLCVADTRPRAWKRADAGILEDLARSVGTELELRAAIDARKQAEADLARLRGVLDHSPALVYANDLAGGSLFANRAAQRALPARALGALGEADAAGEPCGVCAVSVALGPVEPEAAPVSSSDTGQLNSAKALLRRLETAVDAAQSALATGVR